MTTSITPQVTSTGAQETADAVLDATVSGGKVQVAGTTTVTGTITTQGEGSAGAPAGGVNTVQGVTGGTPVVTADTVLDATVAGGAVTTTSTMEGVSKGTTVAAGVTVKPIDPNTAAMSVLVANSGSQPVDVYGPGNSGTFPMSGQGGNEVAVTSQGFLSTEPIVSGNPVATGNPLPVAGDAWGNSWKHGS
jgi:hypothetical protein